MQQQNYPPQSGKVKPIRRIFGLLFLIFLIGGGYLLIRSIINDTATYAQPDALFYNAGGHTIMATVVTHESGANSGFAYKGDGKYAEAFDLESGKRLWRIELDAKDNRNEDFGDAALLGQSAKYLFFWRNELYVIDKQTGDVAAQNNYFADVKDKMFKEQITSYRDDRIKFAYNDSLQTVLFKGNDGLLYTINGLTLKTGTISITDPDHYFKRNEGVNYDNLIAIAYDGKQSLTLLGDKENLILQANNTVEEVRRQTVEKSVRRFIYSHPSDKLTGDWRKISEAVYIYGGFLTDPRQTYHQPADSLTGNEAYKLLTQSYNTVNAPIRLNDGGLIIMHKVSMENTAAVLLTALLPDGKVKWQINTAYSEIDLLYRHPQGDKLVLMGRPAGKYTYPMQQVLILDLISGATYSYPIK
ncbi:MAG: hypothetical protein JWR38_1718 [Mucilaginibacter sp.]|nr:hypothetical protein [Mucilaginibacter sp.]